VVYGYQQIRGGLDRFDLRAGRWLVGYLVAILITSAVGSFGGAGAIGAPWDSVGVTIIGAVAFLRGVREAQRYLAARPAAQPEPVPAASR
jgi:hypothetical protein